MPYVYVDHMKCKSCGQSNCLFYAFVRTTRGNKLQLTKSCKLCWLEDRRLYKLNNIDRVRKQDREWAAKNQEGKQAARERWLARNPDFYKNRYRRYNWYAPVEAALP